MNSTVIATRHGGHVEPCVCTSNDLVIRLEDPTIWGFDSLLEINMIQCTECGRTVWGGDEDSVADWNSQRYDDGPDREPDDRPRVSK